MWYHGNSLHMMIRCALCFLPLLPCCALCVNNYMYTNICIPVEPSEMSPSCSNSACKFLYTVNLGIRDTQGTVKNCPEF